jgi:hypothetical protein
MHSAFPNKQERFIMPIIPLIVILGVAGWQDFVFKSRFWQKRRTLLKNCWVFFWILNLLLLPVVSVTYSKRSRVESMSYLYRYKNIQSLLIADAHDNPEMMPRFYLGQWPHIDDEFVGNQNTDSLIVLASKKPVDLQPSFFLFTGGDLRERVVKARKYFPFLIYETTIEPGFVDKVMHWLNPVNKMNRVYIYRNAFLIRDKVVK